MEPIAEPEEPEYKDATHWKTALHRPVASPAKKAAETGFSLQTALNRSGVEADKEQDNLETRDPSLYRQFFTDLAGTLESAPVVKEAAENTVRASQIERTANIAETLGVSLVVKEEAGRSIWWTRVTERDSGVWGSCSDR